ncbi:MAG: hypothetical protein MJ239_04790 [Bacilli bacterium]|nr:hypothetical protein [Bacilli bacterium]
MKKKNIILVLSAAMLVGCNSTQSSTSAPSSTPTSTGTSSIPSSESSQAKDALEAFIEGLRGDNMTVTDEAYAIMEFYGPYGTYTTYQGEYALWSQNVGTFYVENVGFCDINEDKEVTIALPTNGKHALSEYYFMPKMAADFIEESAETAITKTGDNVYSVEASTALLGLGMLGGFDEYTASYLTDGTITVTEDGYDIYVHEDRSAEREAYGLTEEDLPDTVGEYSITEIGTTAENEIAQFAKTYVPVGLSQGLTTEQVAAMMDSQKDEAGVNVVKNLTFTALSFFEVDEFINEWHIMDYSIGNVAETLRTGLTAAGYTIQEDLKRDMPETTKESLICYKNHTETDEISGETWTASYNRFTYAYTSPEAYHEDEFNPCPDWAYPNGRSAFAGSYGEYMQPSVCLSSWNTSKDVYGDDIPAYIPGITLDKTTYADMYGTVTFNIFYDTMEERFAEGQAYDAVLEAAGWAGGGWAVYTDTYGTSTRNCEADEEGNYTYINITATGNGLNLSIGVSNVNWEY